MNRKADLLAIIKCYGVYSSRKRILHKVKNIEQVGKFLDLAMGCDIIIRVKNSRRGRATRWLLDMIYSETCKRCSIPREILNEVTPIIKNEHLRHRKAILAKGARK